MRSTAMREALRLAVTLLLGVGPLGVAGCAETEMLPPASVAAATHGRIRGVVRIGGAPRAGVEVSLVGTGTSTHKASGFTSTSGEVIFDGLPFGGYTMTVRSPTTGRTMGNPVTVSATAASASVDFDLGR